MKCAPANQSCTNKVTANSKTNLVEAGLQAESRSGATNQMRSNVYSKCLLGAVYVLTLAHCVKHTTAPLTTLLPPPPIIRPLTKSLPPILAVFAATPPSAFQSRARKGDRGIIPQREPKLLYAVRPAPENAPPIGTITVDVPVKLGGGRSAADLETMTRNALDTLPITALIFKCPARISAGSSDEAQLTTAPNLEEQFREQLRARGISGLQTAAIALRMEADLTSADKEAFEIQPKNPPNNAPSYARAWRIQARNTGNYELDLKVTLSARIPSIGDVQRGPLALSRWVSVGGEHFLAPYRTAIAGSLAGLLGVWIAWTVWRGRRSSVFSHR